ncbi:MAG: dephospho-CoA kinase [Mucinivorans sp.]
MIRYLLGLTGLIGSGKSSVAARFALLGLPVYDCDRRAKELMNTNQELRAQIVALFGADIYIEGELDRARMASIIFRSPDLRAALERVVHPAVGRDIELWRTTIDARWGVVESAILVSAGIARAMAAVLVVTAPSEVRLARVMARDSMGPEQVRERMAAQLSELELQRVATWCLANDQNQELDNKVARIYEKMTNFAVI